jgi:magnesium-transporting ATPase (P-type)
VLQCGKPKWKKKNDNDNETQSTAGPVLTLFFPPPGTRKVDILATIKFNSTRKRSSVIARFKATGSHGVGKKSFSWEFPKNRSWKTIKNHGLAVLFRHPPYPFLITLDNTADQFETNWGDRPNTFQHISTHFNTQQTLKTESQGQWKCGNRFFILEQGI